MLEQVFGIADQRVLVVGETPIACATSALFEQVGACVEQRDVPPEEEAMITAFAEYVSRHGGMDILVFATTRTGTYSLPDMTLDQWDAMHNTNLRAAFLAFREAVRIMKGQGRGIITAVSTMGSVHPVLVGNGAYGSSKAGLNALVRSTALDHAADGIRVNCILPGAVPVGEAPEDVVRQGGPAQQPGRLMLGMGTADDVSAAILFLCSPAARFITGQAFALDGGFLIS